LFADSITEALSARVAVEPRSEALLLLGLAVAGVEARAFKSQFAKPGAVGDVMSPIMAMGLATFLACTLIVDVLSNLLFDHLLLDAPQQRFAFLEDKTWRLRPRVATL
jgi:hypothetical protein